MKVPQTRLEEGKEFSKRVHQHIERYANQQYSDKGEDSVTHGDLDSIMDVIYKYYKRYKTNQRPGEEQLDLLKMAHYICMAYGKREEQDDKETGKETVLLAGNAESIAQDFDRLEEALEDTLEQEKNYEIILREK